MNIYVLDAFALLAHFKNEPGALRMGELFAGASAAGQDLPISAVNLAEVIYKTIRQFGPDRAQQVLGKVRQLPIDVVDIDEQLALDAAVIKGTYRISYADCIAAALAQRLGAILVTGDRGFEQIPGLKLEMLSK